MSQFQFQFKVWKIIYVQSDNAKSIKWAQIRFYLFGLAIVACITFLLLKGALVELIKSKQQSSTTQVINQITLDQVKYLTEQRGKLLDKVTNLQHDTLIKGEENLKQQENYNLRINELDQKIAALLTKHITDSSNIANYNATEDNYTKINAENIALQAQLTASNARIDSLRGVADSTSIENKILNKLSCKSVTPYREGDTKLIVSYRIDSVCKALQGTKYMSDKNAVNIYLKLYDLTKNRYVTLVEDNGEERTYAVKSCIPEGPSCTLKDDISYINTQEKPFKRRHPFRIELYLDTSLRALVSFPQTLQTSPRVVKEPKKRKGR